MKSSSSSNIPCRSGIEIGAMVRAPRRRRRKGSVNNDGGNYSKDMLWCRGMICTISEDGGAYANVLWEKNNYDSSCYLVAPKFETITDNNNEEEEGIVPVEQIQPLLPFETTTTTNPPISPTDDSSSSSSTTTATIDRILQLKQQGDTLLTLRDPYAAMDQYEQALFLSSKVEIGGTIIFNRKGYPTLAHVDCIDIDQLQVVVDVTQQHSNNNNSSQEEEEEIEISSSKVLLALLVLPKDIHSIISTTTDDSYLHLQERILLNLARCFLWIVQEEQDEEGRGEEEDERTEQRSRNRKTKYLQASVLACTLVLTCLTAKSTQMMRTSNNYTPGGGGGGGGEDTTLSTTTTATSSINYETKARYLRATTYLQLHKLQHALSDVQYIISSQEARGILPNGGGTSGNNSSSITSSSIHKLKREIQSQIVQRKQLNKQLTKDMCQWLQEATKNLS